MDRYAQRVLADGAEAYWRLQESSGLVLIDEVGSHHATLVNNAGITYRVPGALSNSYGLAIALGADTLATFAPIVPAEWSFECILKPATDFVSGRAGFLICGQTSDGDGPIVNDIEPGFAQLAFNVAGSLSTDVFHHVVYTMNADGVLRLYVDGQRRDGSGTGLLAMTFASLFNQFAPGVNPYTLNCAFISEMAIYPAALTETQVSEHYTLSLGLITTPGDSAANSYADVDYYRAYWQNRGFNTRQLAADDAIVRAELVWVARVLDASFNWTGSAASATQAMVWPRNGMLTRNGFPIASTEIPAALKDAQSEMAGIYLVKDLTADNSAVKKGISEIKAGPVDIKYQSTSGGGTLVDTLDAIVRRMSSDFDYLSVSIPDSVRRLLVPSWYDQARLRQPILFKALR